MSIEELTHHARREIDATHEDMLQRIDASKKVSATRTEGIIHSIGEKQDCFKQEIKMLNNLISSSQDKLTALTAEYMAQQKENTQNEQKINNINEKIETLMATKNESLPHSMHEIESNNNTKMQELHQKKLKLKELIRKNEQKIKKLLSLHQSFEKYFGCSFEVISQTNCIKISFVQINKTHPTKEYVVQMNMSGNRYSIESVADNQSNKIWKYLEERLNSHTLGLSKFVKIARKYFVLQADKEEK